MARPKASTTDRNDLLRLSTLFSRERRLGDIRDVIAVYDRPGSRFDERIDGIANGHFQC
jgi:hypothetical protein